MVQALVTQCERDLCQHRQATSCGVACIKFEDLAFEPSTPDPHNVKRLEAIFKDASCCPLREENRIRGYIDADVLKTAIRLSNISLEDLFHPVGGSPALLQLPDGCTVKCDDGKSRVAAAKSVLEAKDQVWAVNLYNQGNS